MRDDILEHIVTSISPMLFREWGNWRCLQQGKRAQGIALYRKFEKKHR